MSPALLQCTKCRTPVRDPGAHLDRMAPCPACAAPLQLDVFPALFRPVTPGRGADHLLLETDASCFYHPQKKAVVPCESCGRFLCGLCDCEFRGQHLCPACLEVGGRKGKIKHLETSHTLYDSIALAVAVWPVVLVFAVYLTPLTAPIAVYIALRHWNSSRSLVRRTRIRFVAAVVLAMLELAGCATVAYLIIHGSQIFN